MYCSRCGREIAEDSLICNYCGARQNGQEWGPTANDGPVGNLGIICFLFPLVGFILYLVWKDSMPLKAGGALKAALWGLFVIGLITALLLFVGLAAARPEHLVY